MANPPRERHAAAPRLRFDEQRFIELHKQTEHKVDLMRRYYGQYPSIIATAAKRGVVDATHIYLVDAFAGAGAHLTLQTKTNQIPGTSVQACIEARKVQREFPGTTMHVRLIDASEDACQRLEARVKEFTDPKGPPEHVDVTVTHSECEKQVATILAETEHGRGERYCSLWFFDPYGLEIPRSTFEPLLRSTRGVEILINLDVGAIHRQIGQYYGENATPKMVEDCRRCLNDLYGDERWEGAMATASNYAGELDSLARAYAGTFAAKFKYRQAYKLRSSHGQERYMIHLTNSATAATAFAKSYRESQKVGNAKGNTLLWPDRENIAVMLHDAFRGKEMPFDHLATQTLVPLTKGQANTMLRHIVDQHYATYDESTRIIKWSSEHVEPALPLDRTQHKERVEDRGPQIGFDF